MQNKIKSLIKKLGRFGYRVKLDNSRHVDPVCGMEATGDAFIAKYQGKEYYFCSVHCKVQFEADPENYVK